MVDLPEPVVPVQNQSPALFGDLFQNGRKHQLADRENLDRDDAENHADGPPLLEDVAAETAEAGDRVGDVDFVVIFEFLFLARRHDRERHGDRVFLHQPLQFDQREQFAVHPDDGVRPDLDVKIGGTPLCGNLQ